MRLMITNYDQLNRWMNERRKMGRAISSIKGPPPEGATYEDGELIVRPVNIAWQDRTSGEIFGIDYERTPLTESASLQENEK